MLDHNKHQACSSRTPPRNINLQWCLVENFACPPSLSYRPSESFSCLADQWSFSTSSLLPSIPCVSLPDLIAATAREQWNVGCRFGQPQHCSALFRNCARMVDRVKYKRSCLADPSFLVVVTVVYIQERLRLMEPISTFCNFQFLRRLLSRSTSTAVSTC